jgi:hypothetical protein
MMLLARLDFLRRKRALRSSAAASTSLKNPYLFKEELSKKT